MNHHIDPFAGSFGTLENFVDRVSEVLQCPVTLEDAHHQLLAYSRHNSETDTARIETIIRRRVPEKVIYRLWKDGIIPQLLKTKEPVIVEERKDIGMRTRVAISIWREEEVLGFIWVLDMKQKLNDDSLQLLKKAASAAKSLLLNHQRRKKSINQDSQELFWKLLTGHKVDQEKIVQTAMSLKVSLPESFTVVIFRFKDPLSDFFENRASYFLKTSEKVSVPFYTFEGRDMMILVGCADAEIEQLKDSHARRLEVFKAFMSTFRKNMVEHLGVDQLDGGFGGIYSHYKYVSKSYREAKVVLDVHTKFPEDTQDIISYQELGVYQFLDILLKERSQTGFDNIVIQKLSEYDRENNTQLIETLRTYLDENENTHKTAAKMHIHLNTLNYRLKRMTDITGFDFSQPHQKFMLYLDLKLLQWQNDQSE